VSRRLTVNARKSYDTLKGLVDELAKSQRAEAYDNFAETLSLVRLAKAAGYLPKGKYEHIKPLISNSDFFESLEEEPTRMQQNLVDNCLTRSIVSAFDGYIDFDDQIYMPILFGGKWPKFPLVMVDEAQDLSPLNHEMLRRLVTSRLIAVGDPYQSIYAFRGAVTASMGKLREQFSMTERTLSVSFRCPQSVVQRARSRVPHMKWPDWATEGIVADLSDLKIAEIPDDAAIICRNNAPLFSAALRLIRAKRGIRLVGSDIGPGLIKTLKKLGPESMTRAETFDAIDRYEAAQAAKSRAPGSLADKCSCLRVFAEQGETLAAGIAYAEYLFSSTGSIQLLSGHKAKGLEWDTVYHLDPWRIPSSYATSEEDIEQELNIRYVIETRAKRALYLINLENLT
jgi:superfamily I DNA/RNA helicase